MKIIAFLFLLAFTACHAPYPGPVVDVVDCTKANQGQIEGVLAGLLPLLSGNAPDWGAIESQAERAGADIGGCALSELVQQYLGGTKAEPNDQTWLARDTLEHFRAEHAPAGHDVHYRTADGEL